jgi:hypothetical protein
MAKRPLKEFEVKLVEEGVEVSIVADRIKPYRYLITTDERHPDAKELARHLEAGLIEAKETFAKVGISEYLERHYVFIELPIQYHSNQYTARKI